MAELTTGTLIGEAWKTALDEMADLGTTDRHYGRDFRPGTELWQRAARIYRIAARRPGQAAPADVTTVLPEQLTDEQWNGSYLPLVEMVCQVYGECWHGQRAGRRMVSMDNLALLLRAKGHTKAYVEQTGGGCATLYSGGTWRDEHGDDRQDAVFGPGSFYGLDGWQEPYASCGEMFLGRDDDGAGQHHKLPDGATDEEIVEAIHAQIVASQAQSAVAAAVQKARDGVRSRTPFGDRLTDEQHWALREEDAAHCGGDADWRIAVNLYELDEPITVSGREVLPAGTYVLTVEGKHELAFPVADRHAAREYVWAVEDEYRATCPNAV